jgi:hypothetical protein
MNDHITYMHILGDWTMLFQLLMIYNIECDGKMVVCSERSSRGLFQGIIKTQGGEHQEDLKLEYAMTWPRFEPTTTRTRLESCRFTDVLHSQGAI